MVSEIFVRVLEMARSLKLTGALAHGETTAFQYYNTTLRLPNFN